MGRRGFGFQRAKDGKFLGKSLVGWLGRECGGWWVLVLILKGLRMAQSLGGKGGLVGLFGWLVVWLVDLF